MSKVIYSTLERFHRVLLMERLTVGIRNGLKFSAARQQPDRSTLGRDSRLEVPETATENGN